MASQCNHENIKVWLQEHETMYTALVKRFQKNVQKVKENKFFSF